MPTSIRLPHGIEERLSALAEKTGRSKAFYIREMIENALPELEEVYLAEQVALNVSLGKEKTFSLDEVEAQLGLES
ncbi:ribbon-helix-helix protein, CopG family [Vibrio parahaemolyticus]|nr:ribbon-helix-helix protein, CopG family [Vibrio parahaemolyticus]EIA1590703.1 ribbon-helix-helix protein, CopG family [Vibrio parahaemolyticus]EJE8676127.1 ribbon-helix-helix protein, CopG family [Vibrio parahaemolyticus]